MRERPGSIESSFPSSRVYNEPDNIRSPLATLAANLPFPPTKFLVVYDFEGGYHRARFEGIGPAVSGQLRMVANDVCRELLPGRCAPASPALRHPPSSSLRWRIFAMTPPKSPRLLEVPWKTRAGLGGALPLLCEGGEQHASRNRSRSGRSVLAGWLINKDRRLADRGDLTKQLQTLPRPAPLGDMRLTSTGQLQRHARKLWPKAHCPGYRIVEIPTVLR